MYIFHRLKCCSGVRNINTYVCTLCHWGLLLSQLEVLAAKNQNGCDEKENDLHFRVPTDERGLPS